MLPDVSINIFLLVFIGFGAGTVSGFAGVGGGFLVTPALIILGFPANLAVGVSLTWVAGNCVVGAFRHVKMGNVDLKLGLIVTVAATAGMEVGVRALNWSKDAGLATESVLALTLVTLLSSGSYTLLESARSKRRIEQGMGRRAGGTIPPSPPLARFVQGISLPPVLQFPKAGVSLSLWTVLALGFGVGVVAGVIGVGGGFIMVPSLVYLLGLPSFVTVGTALFQTLFSAGYGVVRHSLSGNVVVFASAILLLASSVGVQIGASATRYVRGVSMRYVLGVCTLLAALGASLKLAGVLSNGDSAWSETGSQIVAFGGIGLAVVMVLSLFLLGIRYRRGRRVPSWTESLLSDDKR
jgi:uncharacterized membrane protein YfcA